MFINSSKLFPSTLRSLPPNIKWSIIDRWGCNPLFAKTFADRIREELDKFCETKRDSVVI